MGQIQVEKDPKGIKGLRVITPTVHGDERGYFMETYNENDMKEQGMDMVFVQDNQSMSGKGVLRGLHFQKQYPQGKLVRVIRGQVFDVAVDLRKGSETYGKWYGIILSEENKKTVKEYEERGIKFTFSTGRIDNELEEVSSKMPYVKYGIMCNGALFHI